MIVSVLLLAVFVFLFCREVRLDQKRYLEQDRLGDEHILREIEKFMQQKAQENDRVNDNEIS